MSNCVICGKFEHNGCGYCSYACCLQGMDNMVCTYGGTLEAAEEEILSLCGECAY